MSVPTAVGVKVWLPVLAWAPDQVPEAVQPWLFAEDQVSVVELPIVMELDASVSVGAGGRVAGIMAAAIFARTNPYPAA